MSDLATSAVCGIYELRDASKGTKFAAPALAAWGDPSKTHAAQPLACDDGGSSLVPLDRVGICTRARGAFKARIQMLGRD